MPYTIITEKENSASTTFHKSNIRLNEIAHAVLLDNQHKTTLIQVLTTQEFDCYHITLVYVDSILNAVFITKNYCFITSITSK